MKRTALKLTKRLIDSFRFEGPQPKAQDIRWDGGDGSVKGFGVRIYPTGKKEYVVSYRDEDGRKHIINVRERGTSGTLTVDEARTKAKALLADVGRATELTRTGVKDALPLGRANPAEARKRKEPAAKTVSDLITAFLTQHAEAKRRPRTASEYRRQLETHVKPRWGSRPAKSIKRADVAALHTELGARAPTQANRTLSAISKMFNFGKIKGFVPDDAMNPAQGVERFKETKRDRWVKPGELPRLVEAINAEPNPYARAGVWLYLLTGARRNELLNAKWEDVDEERRELRLPTTKAGRSHYIPLNKAALSILEGVPKVAGNPYILAGSRPKGHLGDINKPFQHIRKAAGIEDVRLHDLRRTVGSWLATAGESLPLIGKVLNHSTPSTTAIYARLAEDPARRAMEEYGRRIMEAAQPIRLVK